MIMAACSYFASKVCFVFEDKKKNHRSLSGTCFADDTLRNLYVKPSDISRIFKSATSAVVFTATAGRSGSQSLFPE